MVTAPATSICSREPRAFARGQKGGLLAPLLAGALFASAVQAQTGLMVVAHGASVEWNSKVREVVSQVRWAHGPVAVAFLMGAEAAAAGWDVAVESLRARGVGLLVVVPLFVSTHGFHYEETEYNAGLRDTLVRPVIPSRSAGTAGAGFVAATPPAGGGAGGHAHGVHHRPAGVPTVVTPAIDAAPELGVILAARWSGLDSADRRRPVMLVAHGPNADVDANRWVANLSIAAAALRGAGLTQPLRIGLLRDDAPPPVRAAAIAQMRDTIQALATRSADSVVVMTVLISSGGINRVTIPRDLQGLPIRYAPTALAAFPETARWIERVAEAFRSTVTR